jgi:hypothetical protein
MNWDFLNRKFNSIIEMKNVKNNFNHIPDLNQIGNQTKLKKFINLQLTGNYSIIIGIQNLLFIKIISYILTRYLDHEIFKKSDYYLILILKVKVLNILLR